MRPLLGDPPLLGLVGAPPLLHPITTRKLARHTVALRLGPCSNRAIGLSKEGSGFQFRPGPLFALGNLLSFRGPCLFNLNTGCLHQSPRTAEDAGRVKGNVDGL